MSKTIKTAKDLEDAQAELVRTWLQANLELLFMSGQRELDGIKKTISMPGGGIYILQFQHVTGPKFDVTAFFTPEPEKAKAPVESVASTPKPTRRQKRDRTSQSGTGPLTDGS